ncbi:hypothetical protein [Candidatus Velamenicoccus archaeovorus]|nr:hypothetical protein [Candidatus Velamenicoccus archaeovorus]
MKRIAVLTSGGDAPGMSASEAGEISPVAIYPTTGGNAAGEP